MEPCEINPGFRYQCCKFGDKIEGFEDDVCGSVAVRCFQFVAHPAIDGETEALFSLIVGAGATNVTLVTFLVPVSAILLGIWALGESLELIHLVGMVLIAIGLSVIDGRLWRF